MKKVDFINQATYTDFFFFLILKSLKDISFGND